MRTFTPVWSMIVESSLWDESDVVVKVFMTMLALKDSDHVYRGTAYQLARQSRKTESEVLEVLRVLSSPDTRRISPQPFEGRRIRAVEDGWLVLNGEKYRELMSEEMRKARARRAQARWRERQKILKSRKPSPGEVAFVAAAGRGDQEACDRLSEPKGYPEHQPDPSLMHDGISLEPQTRGKPLVEVFAEEQPKALPKPVVTAGVVPDYAGDWK